MSNDDPLERRAVERLQRGDAAAYDYLVTKHLPRVVSILRGVVRNAHDAEDLAQEAFVKAYAGIHRFRAGEPFGPWVCRIAMNGALDLLRHRTRVRQEAVSDDHRTTRGDEAALNVMSGEIARRIDDALEELPDMQRIVARLYLVEELGQDEIAALTGLSDGTVRSHLSLARKKLREQLGDLYGNEHA